MSAPPEPGLRHGVYRREGPGLEFDRVSFFSDAIFAIAMTLLVVELHVPEGPASALPGALAAERPAIICFFIAFLVIGRYWLAHHRFFASLGSVDEGMIGLNLVYLAFVAFSPFPVSLISRHSDSPLSFAILALTMAAISGLEVVLLALAVRGGHLRRPLSPAARRYEFFGASLPVALMLLSIPLALASPTVALSSWLVMIPLGIAIHRRAPRDAAD